MKAQACTFKRNQHGAIETGIAILNKGAGFGDCIVDVIIDENLQPVDAEEIWDYHFKTHPMACLDTAYIDPRDPNKVKQ